ncbi:UNVERIFIED_ORG: uncharacterized protein DUF4148 [Zoogloea ramigera]|uniref:DUF4148 domain-containing protein n=1 Tax=Duganella zoogloeoides TaxID=75659 RepID=A0ABZ0XUS7_9BURK|nr:DUF4148 domain-containing protein [Duganella zoogloeoides]WQH03293.1 DUF4148 domain-containing protein [Duganella zoogloeoides]
MSTTTKDLLRAAATVVFAIAATATTVSSAFAAEAAVTNTTVVAKSDQPHQLTRAEVQAQVIEARKNGTLLETEADFDVAQTRQHVAK